MRYKALVLPAAILFGLICVVLYASLSDAVGFGLFDQHPQEDPFTPATAPETVPAPSVPESGAISPTASSSDSQRPTDFAEVDLPTLNITHLVENSAEEHACFPHRINSVYVPETGHHIHRPFLPYWEELGTVTLGLPVSEPETQGMRTVQYFEQARLEYQPGTRGDDSQMMLTALGIWHSQMLDHPAFEPTASDLYPASETTRYFEQSQHYLRPPFFDHWSRHGGRSVFGQPISDQFDQDGVLVQYFEQARFEWDEAASAVLISPLGRALADALKVDQKPVERRASVVDYTWEPATLSVRVPTLMYHKIGAPARRYRVSLWMFEQQLIWLRDNGYTTVTMDQAYAAVYRGAPLPEKPVLITFDDGWAGQWEAAALLDAYGMHGVFFVMPNKIELTHDQVRNLLQRGHEIGSHSVAHAHLPEIGDDELWNEIASSKAMIEEIVGESVDYFAYPYGEFDERVVANVEAAGYCGAVQAMHPEGLTWHPETRWTQPRIEIPGKIDLTTFAQMIEGA